MSDAWRQEFRKAYIDAIVRLGGPLDPKCEHSDSYGAWYHPDAAQIQHKVRMSGIDYAKCGEPQEASWSHWEGTFDDASTKYGVDIDIAIRDGKQTVVRYRYDGSLSEIIQEVIKEPS